ncbi:MAG: DNA polymerase III subunit epsilon [Gammaproteobacteria bacterium]|nr:DNA polymerase III subunit epsilon [Gammaproteobacteria bacterium]
MRQIILDTETTGLEVSQGHRIIEIGCVEIISRRITGRNFHRYLNPDRDIDEGAFRVHGISRQQLMNEPRFAEIASEFLSFVEGAELVIHNAAFDIGFLNAEIARLPGEPRPVDTLCGVLDTLKLAREIHPGQRNNLDALSKRYGVDISQRDLHGALLDAQILADVFLAMTGGQSALELGESRGTRGTIMRLASAGGDLSINNPSRAASWLRPEGLLPVIRATTTELAAHEILLDHIAKSSGGKCIFREFDSEVTAVPSA